MYLASAHTDIILQYVLVTDAGGTLQRNATKRTQKTQFTLISSDFASNQTTKYSTYKTHARAYNTLPSQPF